MKNWPRIGRVVVMTTILTLIGLSFGWQRIADGGDTTSIVSVSAGARNGKTPRQVLIVRHGEKSNDAGDIHLDSRGAARAAALPSLFVIPPTFPTKPAPFATPSFLFATKESKQSNRPVETITPLSKALGKMHIHQKHANKDYQDVVNDLFGDAKYAKKVVLICWHHGKIPELAQAVAAKAKNAASLKKQIPEHWHGTVFDRVFVFSFDEAGNAAFADSPQKLLFGDSSK